MALKAAYGSADDIPEAHKDLYSEAADGRFVLDLEDVDSHPKVRGVITANKENARKAQERQAKIEELTAKLAEIPDGFDAEEYLALKAGAGGEKDGKKADDEHLQSQRQLYEQRIANLTKKHEADIAALNDKLTERDGYIDKTTRLDVLRKALRDAGVDPDFEEAAEAVLAPAVKVRRADDGARKAFVETDLGEVDVPSFVKDWSASKGQKFLAKALPMDAPGSRNLRAGAKTITRAEFSKLDPAAQKKAVLTDKMTVVD